MSERSSVRVSLGRKVAVDGDWDAATASPDDEFELQIHAEPGEAEAARRAIEGAGGEIRSDYGTFIVATVRADRVPELADSDAIRLVGEYIEPVLHEVGRPISPRDGTEAETEGGWEPSDEEMPVTEGVEIHNADTLHDQGITGEGVTIAILDTGFDVENERYADQVIATLGEDDLYEGNEDGHGDNVADIIAALAPDADLVLADTFDGPDLDETLDTIEEDYPEVDVANYSVGHTMDMRIDGLDEISQRLDEFTDDGRLFVNSAGNSGAVEVAWMWDSGDTIPLPQGYGEAYDSQGEAVFTEENGRDLLEFDANFEEDLPISTRLPAVTFDDVVLADESPLVPADLGWIITHWDEDPKVDDEEYEVFIYQNVDDSDELTSSSTQNPWETIDVLAEWFRSEVHVTMDVEEGDWVVTSFDAGTDIEEIDEDEPNPELTFQMGQRYVIENDAHEDHPLEFREENGTVLLSQDGDGEFEDDEFVDWEDDGDELSFEITDGLQASGLAGALDGAEYRSADDDEIAGDVETADTPPIHVEVENVDASGEHHFDVWAQFGGVDIAIPWATDARSVGIPAVSQDPNLVSVAAVQAVDVGDPDEGYTDMAFNREAGDLKSYSSQGPTQDDRLGVDIAGTSHVSTNAGGPVSASFGFNGTSAAAPHVAGVAGQLFQVDGATAEDVREALYATDREIDDEDVEGTDNTQIGNGYLDAEVSLNQLLDEETTLDASGDTIPVDGEANLSIEATQVDEIVIEALWLDWDADWEEPNENVDDRVDSEGVLEYSWSETQTSVSLSPSVSPPDRYVGGTYFVSITAVGPEETVETLVTIEIN